MATAGQQSRSIVLAADPKSRQRNELAADSIVLTDFGGVNQQSPRERIGENEFFWLEELIPIASGNLLLTKGPGAIVVTVAGETGAPSYALSFDVAGVDYQFAVWANSGNAWVGPQTTSAGWTKIASALYASGKTAAAQWSNKGLLIVDPVVGYRDWNVSAASTLTNLSGQVYSPVLTLPLPSGVTSVGVLTVNDTGAGSGAAVGVSITAVSAVITAAGTGYLAGDVLTLTGGTRTTNGAAPLSTQNQPTVLTVTAVSGAGAITSITFTNTGYYQTVPSNPVSVTGGAGSGATFTLNWTYSTPFMISAGANYVAPYLKIGGVSSTVITFLSSGTTLGTAVAVYAGRVWIAINRTVQFTDINSYSSFGGSGGSFTINDSYLHNNITALAAANNYLYIFGDESLDILSNVTVQAGLTQFSRINVSASIGCTQPLSIFPWIRSLAFANNSGFYVVSGATPEKISDKLDNLIAAVDFTAKIYGMQVMVDNILCAAFLVKFTDSFVNTPPVARSILCLLFRGKWWFTKQLTAANGQLNAVTSNPVLGLSTGYGWSGNSFYGLLSMANTNQWLLKTRLWDAGVPLLDKQALKAGIGMVTEGNPLTSVKVYIDNEKGVSELTTIAQALNYIKWINDQGNIVQWVNNAGNIVQWVGGSGAGGYELFIGSATVGGGKYIGLTATGQANATQVRLLAVEFESGRPW